MKLSSLFLYASSIFAMSVCYGQDISNGKRLHDAHCLQCHTADIYTRENRIVNSYDGLKQRIRQCELSDGLAWFDEEINDVAAYLNTAFYKFPADP